MEREMSQAVLDAIRTNGKGQVREVVEVIRMKSSIRPIAGFEVF
jgi:hypothetical protein